MALFNYKRGRAEAKATRTTEKVTIDGIAYEQATHGMGPIYAQQTA